MFRRTRIVCTIGPASSSPSVLTNMIRAGMNVARLNFSHGTHEQHEGLCRNIRAAARKTGKMVTIMQDLQGPKIRVGALPDVGLELHEGQQVSFSTGIKEFLTNGAIPVSYPRLHRDLKKGERILLDDGFIEGIITNIRGKVIQVKITHGGILRSHKGMNFPDSKITIDPFTEKDRVDLLFGIAHEVDWIVLSFISQPGVVEKVRRSIRAAAKIHGVHAPWIMAKIETKLALENFDAILEEVDGIMLGRGDLGLEIPMEEVPMVQKELIEKCRRAGKPIIVATHMLDSMVRNPRATRAEVSDVANAVLDHTDGVMLSAESASGRYPSVTVQAMAAVIDEAEHSRFDAIDAPLGDIDAPPVAMAHAVAVMAMQGMIAAIVTTSELPDVAFILPRYRPHVPIFIACSSVQAARQVMLYAGAEPVLLSSEMGSFIPRAHAFLQKSGALKVRDRVVYVHGGGGTLSLSLHGG